MLKVQKSIEKKVDGVGFTMVNKAETIKSNQIHTKSKLCDFKVDVNLLYFLH